jgi:hypothetical protein
MCDFCIELWTLISNVGPETLVLRYGMEQELCLGSLKKKLCLEVWNKKLCRFPKTMNIKLMYDEDTNRCYTKS